MKIASLAKSLGVCLAGGALLLSGASGASALSLSDTAKITQLSTNVQERSLELVKILTDAPNKTETFESFSASDQKLVTGYFTIARTEVVKVEVTPVKAAASSKLAAPEAAAGCSQRREYRKAFNEANMAVADFWTTAEMCGSPVKSGRIIDSGGLTGFVGFTYKGEEKKQFGIVSGKGYAYSQQKFATGILGWDLQTKTYCARVIGTGVVMYGDGNCSVG